MAFRPSFKTFGLHQGPQGTQLESAISHQKHGLLHHAKHNDLQVPVIKGLACCIMPSVSVIHNWFGASCPYKNCLEPSGRHSTSFIRQAQQKNIRN
jgi:hypothetical protein